MRNRSKLVLAIGVLGMTLASASVAREDALPRGADNRRGEPERHQVKDDAVAKSSLSTTTSTSRANDDPAGDRHGRKDVPDDNNRNKRNDDGPNHR